MNWTRWLITFLIIMAESPVSAAPFIPNNDAHVLERLPFRPTDPVARELRFLREELGKNPGNLNQAAQLAQRYIEQGRAEADPRYNGYAQAALSQWWGLVNPPPKVLVLRATIRQSSHDFKGALSDLSKALQFDPNNAQAWVTQAVIFQTIGEYKKAKRSCIQLYPLTTELVTITCLAGAGSLSGQAAQSFDLLQKTMDRTTNASPQEQLWARTVLAEIAARMGNRPIAEAQFKQALDLDIRDPYLLMAYADFLLAYGRPREVLSLLKNETRIDGLLLRLALAEKQVGSPDLPGHVALLKARFEAARLRGDAIHLREESLFTLEILEKPNVGLKLAQQNWAVQREPLDAQIFMQAALRANHPIEAKPVLNWLIQTGLQDGQLAKLSKQLKERQP
jgi:Flp pilus assembly protein TadD